MPNDLKFVVAVELLRRGVATGAPQLHRRSVHEIAVAHAVQVEEVVQEVAGGNLFIVALSLLYGDPKKGFINKILAFYKLLFRTTHNFRHIVISFNFFQFVLVLKKCTINKLPDAVSISGFGGQSSR